MQLPHIRHPLCSTWGVGDATVTVCATVNVSLKVDALMMEGDKLKVIKVPTGNQQSNDQMME
jgi:hypothetical protein